jgi:hypothetical protein
VTCITIPEVAEIVRRSGPRLAHAAENRAAARFHAATAARTDESGAATPELLTARTCIDWLSLPSAKLNRPHHARDQPASFKPLSGAARRLSINHLTQHCDYYERALPPLSSTWSETETSVERSSHHVHS